MTNLPQQPTFCSLRYQQLCRPADTPGTPTVPVPIMHPLYNRHATRLIPLPPEPTMMTPSNGSIFRVTGPLCGEFTGPGEFPTQRPVTWSFDVFFDLRINKRLSKQPWGWWFETQSRPLWRHRNDICLPYPTLSPTSPPWYLGYPHLYSPPNKIPIFSLWDGVTLISLRHSNPREPLEQ